MELDEHAHPLEYDDVHVEDVELDSINVRQEMTVLDWMESHHFRFGDTVNFFCFRQVLNEGELIEAIRRALDTNQPITDEDFGTSVLDDADS